jgi:predicted dehydrogenase
MRPYARAFPPRPAYHPHDWRGYWAFGTGVLGDMACHTANMAFRALKLDAPVAVVAETGPINPETYPAWAHIQYLYAARGAEPACTLHWYEGKRDGKKLLPPEELLAKLLKKGEKLADSGSILVGDKGTLFSPNDYGARFRLTPEEDFAGVQTTRPEALPAGADRNEDEQMKKEWAEAIRAGKPSAAFSNFDYAGRLTEAMLLGNIAMRFGGTKLEWDAARLRFANSAAATQLVSKEYRKGWDFLTGTS